MHQRRIGRGLSVMVAVGMIVASCGGGDDDGNGAAPDTSATPTASTAEDAPTEDTATEDTATEDTATEDESTAESDGGSTPNCDAIFSMAEIEEFFAEPAELSEETDDSLGQLVCNWESIEDPDDLDDLAFKVLTVQLYSGDPIDAAAFVDPSIYESVTTIEGVGDLAFSTDDIGLTFAFVDEPVSGLLSYTEANLDDAAPELRSSDDVEQLFRTFHERVT